MLMVVSPQTLTRLVVSSVVVVGRANVTEPYEPSVTAKVVTVAGVASLYTKALTVVVAHGSTIAMVKVTLSLMSAGANVADAPPKNALLAVTTIVFWTETV